ncbi:MAG: acyltransferase family protein [Acetobacter sp.]|nr:acyltransferase family protein [Acetobacter sp.]
MVGIRESRFEFIVKRFFRIFPPILFSLIVVLSVVAAALSFFPTKLVEANCFMLPQWGVFSWDSFNISTFLENLFLISPDFNGVMWTLRFEATFYVLVFLFLPLLKNKPTQFYTLISLIYTVVCTLKHKGVEVYLILGSLFYLMVR